MASGHQNDEKKLSIPAALDVARAGATHATLVAALEASESDSSSVLIDLEEGTPSPLALQLVASAARSFPTDRFRLGPRASAALTEFDLPKEN